jgi:archaellum component FlaC
MTKEELQERLNLLRSKYDLDISLRSEILKNLRDAKKLKESSSKPSHEILITTFERDLSKINEMMEATRKEFSEVKKLLKSVANSSKEIIHEFSPYFSFFFDLYEIFKNLLFFIPLAFFSLLQQLF